MENGQIYKKGSFWIRACAFLIDGFILLIVNSLLEKVFPNTPRITLIIGIVYGTFFLWKFGQTPGMKLFRLKIVSLNYQSVKLSTVLFRETVGKLITTISLNMGYIWALVDKKRQTFHDKLAKTFVVKTDKYGALIPIDREENTTIGQKLEFALIFGIFIFPLLGFITFFGFYYVLGNRPIQIKGIAMNPNYIDGQYYLAQKTNGNLAVGDVVFFQSPKDHDVSFIKRIIATAGDTVLIKGGSVYVNGKILDENKYLTPGTTTFGEAFLKEDQTITVPSNTYFVLGDNREHSSDSREWGFVQKDEIIGKVTFCYWNCYPK